MFGLSANAIFVFSTLCNFLDFISLAFRQMEVSKIQIQNLMILFQRFGLAFRQIDINTYLCTLKKIEIFDYERSIYCIGRTHSHRKF